MQEIEFYCKNCKKSMKMAYMFLTSSFDFQ